MLQSGGRPLNPEPASGEAERTESLGRLLGLVELARRDRSHCSFRASCCLCVRQPNTVDHPTCANREVIYICEPFLAKPTIRMSTRAKNAIYHEPKILRPIVWAKR
jgi:hypothetical protein